MSESIKRLFVSFWNPKTKQRDRIWFPDEARRQAFLADLRADYPLSSLAPQIWEDEIDEQSGLPNSPDSAPDGSKGTGSRDVPWTPGPWRVGASSPDRCLIEYTSNRFTANLGECFNYHGIPRRANANLIAAAPELYDTVIKLLTWIADHQGYVVSEVQLLSMPLSAQEVFRSAHEVLVKANPAIQSPVTQQAPDPDAQGGK